MKRARRRDLPPREEEEWKVSATLPCEVTSVRWAAGVRQRRRSGSTPSASCPFSASDAISSADKLTVASVALDGTGKELSTAMAKYTSVEGTCWVRLLRVE